MTVDDKKYTGWAPDYFVMFLHSAAFHLLVMGMILANAIIASTMFFKHDGRERRVYYEKYYYIEVSQLKGKELVKISDFSCIGCNISRFFYC